MLEDFRANVFKYVAMLMSLVFSLAYACACAYVWAYVLVKTSPNMAAEKIIYIHERTQTASTARTCKNHFIMYQFHRLVLYLDFPFEPEYIYFC